MLELEKKVNAMINVKEYEKNKKKFQPLKTTLIQLMIQLRQCYLKELK